MLSHEGLLAEVVEGGDATRHAAVRVHRHELFGRTVHECLEEQSPHGEVGVDRLGGHLKTVG